MFTKRSERISCSLCSFKTFDGKEFSRHLRSSHDNLKLEDYAIILIGGSRPLCLACGQQTRFVHKDLAFRKYCKDHAKVAMVEGGKLGGKAPSIMKGQTKETSAVLLATSERMKGKGNSFFGRTHHEETKKRISITKILKGLTIEERVAARSHEFELLTSISDYHSRQNQYLNFRCCVCKTEQRKTLQAFERGSRCYNCYPCESQWSLEVGQFVKQHADDYVMQDRAIISPKELDHFVPSRKLAIECHGLYYHSELAPDGIIPRAHKLKWELCSAKNIKLISLFSDEWRDKKEICKSIITHRLGKTPVKINGRDCKIVELSQLTAKDFFDANHLNGACSSRHRVGLLHNGKLVAAMSLRIPLHNKKYKNVLEIGRYTTTLYTHIHGGLSKLISHAIKYAKLSGYDGIMTYADRRLGDGEGYERVGFVRAGSTDLDYFYTDGTIRIGRGSYKTDSTSTERQKSVHDGVGRIYGCGSAIFVKLF